jgi:hypothetical protein
MHVFVMRVVSTRQGKDTRAARVAYVSCWINDPSKDRALERATAVIRENGWDVEEIVENHPISREVYSLKPEGLRYYEQALVDGEVLVFHVPKDGSNPENGGRGFSRF